MSDLALVRRLGSRRLRGISLPALRRAAYLLDLCDADSTEPAPLVDLLRQAADTLGGGNEQEAAEYLLGLANGAGLWSIGRRQTRAGELMGQTFEAFRKSHDAVLVGQVAEGMLEILNDATLRRARLDIEQRRHPTDSRLAVQWVERFEAYYRIWTPVYALAADVEAALNTYEEEPAPHPPWDPSDSTPYDPVLQAEGYARMALYHYAQFQLELKRFKSKHGGLWLASDANVEEQIADAVYQIGWHNSFNEDDDAWLRRHLADCRHEEQDHFWSVVLALPRGQRLHGEWQDLVAKSRGLANDEHNPPQAWATVRACQEFCQLVDKDWTKVADWYRQPRSRISVDAQSLYSKVVLGRAPVQGGGDLP